MKTEIESVKNQLHYWKVLISNLDVGVNKTQGYNKNNITQIIKELEIRLNSLNIIAQ